MTSFQDRAEAGRFLAEQLDRFANRHDVIVLALPRGGVVVGAEVASTLHAPLEVLVVRKLSLPGQKEIAMGAIGPGGIRVLIADEIAALGKSANKAVEQATVRETKTLRQRERRYRQGRAFPDLGGKTVLLVDDGMASGASMRAAVMATRQRKPARLIIAVPVASKSSCRQLRKKADEVICALMPEPFFRVCQSYDNFCQITDKEVRALLAGTA